MFFSRGEQAPPLPKENAMTGFRPAAHSFRRIVANLITTFTTRPVDFSTSFLAGSAPVDVWIARRDMFVIQLVDYVGDDWETQPVRTISIVPNTDPFEPEAWNVIGDRTFEGQSVAEGSFKGLDAAVGFALERACARNWHAGVQDAHDPVAV